MSYSQNGEDKIILEYFQGHTGTLIDIGANDGVTLSNSRALIELGWSGIMVEPAESAFTKLDNLYKDSKTVNCINCAINSQPGRAVFHESGQHLGTGDTALLSTLEAGEVTRWGNSAKFTETEVEVITIQQLFDLCPGPYDFISIDAEGVDYAILSQIDLTNVSCVCVEHNGVEIEKYIQYCEGFGMRELHRNGENLIMVK